MKEQLRPALMMWLILTVVTGLAYPLAVTGLAQLFFPGPANGSLIVRDGKVIGSKLLGQYFDKPEYFWSRPSVTSPFPYNAAASGGSNLGPTNPALIEAVKARVAALRAADPGNEAPVLGIVADSVQLHLRARHSVAARHGHVRQPRFSLIEQSQSFIAFPLK